MAMCPRAKWVVLWSLWAARLVRQPTAPVRVSGGLLRGGVANDGSHAHYLAIPYATLGAEDRFKAARPEPTWTGILDAYNEHIRCSQRLTSTRISGQEDCLTLNVYTPLEKSNKLRPVMVFIHGGGFRDGSGSSFLYGPEYLVKHGIVLVTFNYRLEILGFLCLGIKEAPGNAGLKDQVEALKWVKRNIEAFGGNSNDVTIFGESAGSASVLYHMVSPMSKDLFHKAIMQSGSAISPWSLQYEPLKIASMSARQMGHNTQNPYEIYKTFMNMSAEKLLKTRVARADGDIVLSENIYVPCIEKSIPNVQQFLPDSPFNLISKGQYHKVPLVIGYNSAEGYMFVAKENETTISKLDFHKALPRDLQFPTEEEKHKTAEKLQQLYMGNDRICKETLVKFSRYEGESGITYPVIATVELLLKSIDKSVYTYRFSYDGWLNMAKLFYGFGSAPGATHADDLFYMFKVKIPLIVAFFEKNLIDKMSTMWTNFAKYGDPTPEVTPLLPTKWQPTDKNNPHLLVIDKEFSVAPLSNAETIAYWNTTYSKYRRKK